LGVQLANMVQLPEQKAWGVTVQEPSPAQQEPLGGGQGLGLQVAPPVQLPGAAQSASRPTTHEASGWQQAPVGCGQRFGLQLAPGVQLN